MNGSFDSSRWGLILTASLALAACSAAPAQTSSSAVTQTQTPSAAASIAGPSATTEPARSAPFGAITVSMTAFRFMPMSPTARAGTVVFFLKNEDPVTSPIGSHNLVIGAELGYPLASSGYVATGQSAVFKVERLAAGHYVIWCSVPNHAYNGMVGSLTVTP
ncbi:MAG TPA: plastocyanin/azurin family copper-binding protein [Candidatus Limnocylindria bacterium]|nr:plastocyanin/azurin family copper-binding protein [Candidatus Limnocylindria bacterium]